MINWILGGAILFFTVWIVSKQIKSHMDGEHACGCGGCSSEGSCCSGCGMGCCGSHSGSK